MCPEETSQLISLPETIESLEGSATSVNGECVENSSTESGISPIVQCGNMGQWQVFVPCLCNPGYELNGTQDQCTGTKLAFNICLSTSADLYSTSSYYCVTCVHADVYTCVRTFTCTSGMYSVYVQYTCTSTCTDVDVYAPSHCPYISHTFT